MFPEADRPRLFQAAAYDAGGARAAGVALTITVDGNGTFSDDEAAPSRERSASTLLDGIVLFQWYEWPRNGPARDFTSAVTVTWQDEAASVTLENLFE